MATTLLVIDNDTAQCALICTVIREKLGAKAIGVPTDLAATQWLLSDQSRPDLILFDVTAFDTPYERLAALRAHTTNLPIIALVKYGDHASAKHTLNAGAQDYLHKPIAVERLRTSVQNMLLLRDARRENEWLRHSQHFSGPGQDPLLEHLPLTENGHLRPLATLEADIIRFAMTFYEQRLSEVARRLQIGRSTLYRKVHELQQSSVKAA